MYEVIRVLDQHRTLGTYFSPLQILDFLFLIGRLEDQGYNGDSAETALLVSKEDFDKVCVWCSTTEDYTICELISSLYLACVSLHGDE